MLHRRVLMAGLCCLVLLQGLPAVLAEEGQPEKKYHLEMPVSKTFTAETRHVHADVLLHKKEGQLYYATQEPAMLAVVKVGEPGVGKGDKPAKSLFRFLFKVRKFDDKDVNDDTPRIAVEVFRDENTGNLVYVSETGSIAVVPAPKETPKKAPEMRWLYRFPLKVRKSGETDFRFNPLRCNVEVYRESDSGRLLYLAENGNLAVSAPGKPFDAKEAKPARWSHALELRARKSDERDFTASTPRFGMEIYDDLNSETTLYLTETFVLAVLPGVKKVNDKTVDAVWKRGWTSGKVSVEVFHNPNADHLVIITSEGALAVSQKEPRTK